MSGEEALNTALDLKQISHFLCHFSHLQSEEQQVLFSPHPEIEVPVSELCLTEVCQENIGKRLQICQYGKKNSDKEGL